MKVETQPHWSFPRGATVTLISRFDRKTQPFVELDQDGVNKKRPRMNIIINFWIIFRLNLTLISVSIWICSNLIVKVYLWILSNRRKLHAWVRVWKICISKCIIIQNKNRKNFNWPHLNGSYVNGLYLLALIRSVSVWTFRFGSLSSWFRRKSRNCYFYRS